MGLESKDILAVSEWLVDAALHESDIGDLLAGLCERLIGLGIPVDRSRLSWPTLHPLFEAESVLWRVAGGIEVGSFPHQDVDSEEWRRSPIKWMIDNDASVLRRRLEEASPLDDFPLIAELKEQGYTDFVAHYLSTFPRHSRFRWRNENFGIYVTFASRRPGGFETADLDTLQHLLRPLGLACKSAIYPRLMINVTDAYLGPTVAREVLGGQIMLGAGTRTRALVWYSDLRSSTHFSETLDEADYLNLLNVYFECVGRPAIDAGGEILTFIGDAVLVIFPIETGDEDTARRTARAAIQAAAAARAGAERLNAGRTGAREPPIRFGIALHIGDVRFGNIGLAQRLTFSVVGSTVNEVTRIEQMTKTLPATVLASDAVASLTPEDWHSVGNHHLRGMAQPMELFGLRTDR
jgi:adenylate cyclase